MTPENTTIIFGPPGTGKTTELIRLVVEQIRAGIPAREICFVSFTRRAAHEARARAKVALKLEDDDLPWFRTLHSMGFVRMGYTRNQIMGATDYFNIAQQLGLYITLRNAREEGSTGGMSKGDRLLFMENMARTRGVTLREQWESQPDEDINWLELDRLARTLAEYKETNDRKDFTDVIHAFVSEPRVPECQVLFVDEAQDLSPIQWKMVETIAKYAGHTYIAGDDDQSIFRWAGADVQHLIDLAGCRRVLPQSYRVPPAIQVCADHIIGRVTSRVPKSWLPRATAQDSAPPQFVDAIESIDLSAGTWMLLARNSYLLDTYTEYCTSQGFIYTSTTGSPISGEALGAIRLWESLRRGDRLPIADIRRVCEFISPKVGMAYGAKAAIDRLPDNTALTLNELRSSHGIITGEIWHVALDRLRPEEVTYFLTALKRGEKLNREPRIRISTIHSVKGGEADNVVIQLDMADRTYKEYEQNPDDEHRVWYVAVTRARERLFVIEPRGRNYYDL